jgi:hypothetical protein
MNMLGKNKKQFPMDEKVEFDSGIDIEDDYIKREKLEGKVIDFIWADIQGAEIDLILGGKEAFKNVRYFYTEYCDSELYEGEIPLEKILELMPDFEVVEDYQGDVLLKNKTL